MKEAHVYTRIDRDSDCARWHVRDAATGKLLHGGSIPITDWSRAGLKKASDSAYEHGKQWAKKRGYTFIC